ncbi:MAG: CPBP family intramembrane metalloprotease [Anaerolineales bacterium]|nr:CPBP family intramembrane metalloprotease [Anaerolineales bacterium]
MAEETGVVSEQGPDGIPGKPIEQEKHIPGTAWLELAGYLVLGLGLLFVASIPLSLRLEKITLGISLLLYGMNIFFLLGSVLVVGRWSGQLSLADIGFWPVQWKKRWLLIVIVLTITLLPVRMILGVFVMELFGGGMDSLELRMDIFLPGGLSLHGFLLTLLFTGLLVPIAEEMYFRGALYGWLRKHSSYPAALIGSTLLFGFGHMDSPAVAASSLVLGFANAVLYEKTRSIWAPIAVHMLNNSLAVVLIYFSMLVMEQYGPLLGM